MITITYRNPLNKNLLPIEITPENTTIGNDWKEALKKLLQNRNKIEKTYCFLGFPYTSRNLQYLCDELNRHIFTINSFNQSDIWQKNGLEPYIIEEHFSPDSVRFSDEYPTKRLHHTGHNDPSKILGLLTKHEIMNKLHNHFEILQGTVENISPYYTLADINTKYAIRNLNLLCHEIENLCMSQRKVVCDPEWVRLSQITAFHKATRYNLREEHRNFNVHSYDREMGGVYLHWCQIGKTLYEVYRDEEQPDLINNKEICDAITHLKYYSGEFDIEWGETITYNRYSWHREDINKFYEWLRKNKYDPSDQNLSLGYIKVGQIDIHKNFGTDNPQDIWKIMGDHLDIYEIEVDGIKNTFDYCWSDSDFEENEKKLFF